MVGFSTGTGVRPLPIGLNRISWKPLGATGPVGTIAGGPTDGFKSD